MLLVEGLHQERATRAKVRGVSACGDVGSGRGHGSGSVSLPPLFFSFFLAMNEEASLFAYATRKRIFSARCFDLAKKRGWCRRKGGESKSWRQEEHQTQAGLRGRENAVVLNAGEVSFLLSLTRRRRGISDNLPALEERFETRRCFAFLLLRRVSGRSKVTDLSMGEF